MPKSALRYGGSIFDGDLDGLGDLPDDIGRRLTAQVTLLLGDEAMLKNEGGKIFEVVRDNVGAAAKGCQGLAGPIQSKHRAGAAAELDLGVGAGGVNEFDDIVFDIGVDSNILSEFLERDKLFRGDDGLKLVDNGGLTEALEDDVVVFLRRVAKFDLDEEAVDLGLGERESALELDGILGSEDDEGAGEESGIAFDGNLTFLHGLEEGGLGAWGGAVNLVGEQDLGEDGAGAELELAGFLVIEVGAGDIGGEEVGGRLDAAKGTAERLGDRPGEHSLADAGDILEKDMTLAEDSNENELDGRRLADDNFFDIIKDTFTG